MKWIVPGVVIAALALSYAACGGDEDEGTDSTPTQTGVGVTETPSDNGDETPQTVTASPEPTPPPNVCQANPDPATLDVVQVDTPTEFESVTSPVSVSGRIAAFEATFKIRVFDAEGGIAGGVTAMSAEGQTLAPFTADVEFAIVAETPGCIWVYEDSPMDGSPIHIAQIPVILRAD
jgi:hypothetical protein